MGDEIHPSKKTQIAHLKADEAPYKVFGKYTDFADIFSPKLAAELPKHIEINNYAIELLDDRQSPYGPIYSLDFMELETLKAYIENTLASGFIKPSKSPTKAPILFNKRLDGSLRLCMDY